MAKHWRKSGVALKLRQQCNICSYFVMQGQERLGTPRISIQQKASNLEVINLQALAPADHKVENYLRWNCLINLTVTMGFSSIFIFKYDTLNKAFLSERRWMCWNLNLRHLWCEKQHLAERHCHSALYMIEHFCCFTLACFASKNDQQFPQKQHT